MKRKLVVCLLVLASFSAAARAGNTESPGLTGNTESPGVTQTGNTESPGVTGNTESPGFVAAIVNGWLFFVSLF